MTTPTLARMLVVAVAASALIASATTVAADSRDDGQGAHLQANARSDGQHAGWGQDYRGAHQWRRGQRIGYNDWSGAQRVDYRQHNLRAPPRGYEWRESNGQYVLAAVATGLIASIILSNGR